jgi:hypothetical protein
VRGFLLTVLLVLQLVGIGPASAHSPYVSRVEPILLPDGRAGEVRRLHGDGIFFGDPERIIVVDQNGRLLARSQRGGPMSLVCKDRICAGYDHARDQVLNLDAATFRAGGPVVPDKYSNSWELDRDIWQIEDGEEHWGFKVHDASYSEWLSAEFALVRERFLALVIMSIPSGAATLGALVVRRALISRGRSKLMILIRIAVGLAGCAGVVVALFVALYLAALIPMSTSAFLVGLSFGGILVALAAHVLRRLVRSNRAHPTQPLSV